jgi:hypothetical protein
MRLLKTARYRRNHHRGKSAYNRATMWGTVTLGASLNGAKILR